MALVAAVAWVWSLALELLLHDTGAEKKKKPKTKKQLTNKKEFWEEEVEAG